MYIIVGLGNYGNKYVGTRHNVGFATVEEIAKSIDTPIVKSRFKSLIGEGRIGSEKVVLVKPQTYMNLSGEAVRAVADYYDVPHDRIIVIYDDVDLDIGALRIRKKGSGGTHNGMRSIILHLGDSDFPRVRIGIGSPKGRMPLADFVLMRFTNDEAQEVVNTVYDAADAVISIVKNGIDNAMNDFNKRAVEKDV